MKAGVCALSLSLCSLTSRPHISISIYSAGLISATHSYTLHKNAHTHRLLTGCYQVLARAHTSSRPPGVVESVGWVAGVVVGGDGSGGLWVGGQVFWQPFDSSPRTPGCLSQPPLLSTQGLLYQVSVTIALRLSLQIANRCPSRSW